MISESKTNQISLMSMVEHPGGHDGGDFAQTDTYGIANDGSVWYSTDYPSSPTDTFYEHEPSEFISVSTREEALEVLRLQLALVEGHTEVLRSLIKKFEEDVKFVVYFGDEVYEEDDGEEDDGEEDEEDEDDDCIPF